MNKIFGAIARLVHREPVATQAFIQATLAVLVGFGIVNWSNEQIGLTLGLVAAFLALVTRAQVTPHALGRVDRAGVDQAAPAAAAGQDVA
jgi:type IV secretory pathway TrbD component